MGVCVRIGRPPSGHMASPRRGAPLLGPIKASWKTLGQGASPWPPENAVLPAGSWPSASPLARPRSGAPQPLTSTAATVHGTAVAERSFLVSVSFPLFLWDLGTSVPAGPAGQSRALLAGLAGSVCSLPAGASSWAQVHPVVSRPSLASCSGSVLGSWPRSFLLPSVVFRAFSPRSPCFRLGKGRERLPSIVTSEPFGLNSKCGRPRPWGAGVASTSGLSGEGSGNNLGCSLEAV